MGIKEIAAAANVSPATVSNVLNGKNNVSVETRERILELCEAMGYTHIENVVGLLEETIKLREYLRSLH